MLGERERYLHGFLTGLAHLHPQPEAAAALVDELFALVAKARAERDELGRDWHRRLNEVAAERDQARADGIEEGRGDMEHLERKWRAEARAEGVAEERERIETGLRALRDRWSG